MNTLHSNQSSPAVAKRQSQPSEPRGRKLRNAVLVAAFMVVLTSLASADIYSDLTVNLAYNDCFNNNACYVATGSSGSYAAGMGNFHSLAPGYPLALQLSDWPRLPMGPCHSVIPPTTRFSIAAPST